MGRSPTGCHQRRLWEPHAGQRGSYRVWFWAGLAKDGHGRGVSGRGAPQQARLSLVLRWNVGPTPGSSAARPMGQSSSRGPALPLLYHTLTLRHTHLATRSVHARVHILTLIYKCTLTRGQLERSNTPHSQEDMAVPCPGASVACTAASRAGLLSFLCGLQAGFCGPLAAGRPWLLQGPGLWPQPGSHLWGPSAGHRPGCWSMSVHRNLAPEL